MVFCIKFSIGRRTFSGLESRNPGNPDIFWHAARGMAAGCGLPVFWSPAPPAIRKRLPNAPLWPGLRDRKLITHAELFTALAAAISANKNVVFDFAVVDEAQDISVAHLRFFAALGGGRPNALFFAGDLGQRIFQP